MSRLVEKAKKMTAAPNGASSKSGLVRKARGEKVAPAANEPSMPAPSVPSTTSASGAPSAMAAPSPTENAPSPDRNPFFFNSGRLVRIERPDGTMPSAQAPAMAKRFKQAPQGARGDEERARLQAEIARLTAEIARVKAQTEEAEREVRASREGMLREIESATGQTPSEADRRALLSMSSQQFAAVRRQARRAPARELDPRLFRADAPSTDPETPGGRLVMKARRMRPMPGVA